MTTGVDEALAALRARIDRKDPPGAWYTVDQDQIDRFADVCHDHSFIHVDPEQAARRSPYGATVAHGFLTLSLLSHLTRSIPRTRPDPLEHAVTVVNYGFDRVRWPAPVPAGARIRARRVLASAEAKGDNAVQLTHEIVIDIEGGDKPACAATWLTRAVYA